MNHKRQTVLTLAILIVLMLLSFAFSRNLKSLVKYQYYQILARDDSYHSRMASFVKRDSTTCYDGGVFATLFLSGNYREYEEEFIQRYPNWRDYLGVMDGLADPDKSPEISMRLNQEKNTSYLPLILHTIIQYERFDYSEDVLYLFNNQIIEKLRTYRTVNTIYLMPTEDGKLQKATAEEIEYVNKRLFIDDKQSYEFFMENYVFQDVSLIGVPEDLMLTLYGIFTYFEFFYGKDEVSDEISQSLQLFFNEFITLPYYLDGTPLNERSMTLDQFFIHAYLRYHGLDGYIDLCLGELEDVRRNNNWPLDKVDHVISYLSDIGEGLSGNFYQLFEYNELWDNPIRLYLAVMVLQRIGVNDPLLHELSQKNYSPFEEFVIMKNGISSEIIDIHKELVNLQMMIADKDILSVDSYLLYTEALNNQGISLAHQNLDDFMEDDLDRLSTLDYRSQVRIRLALEVFIRMIIFSGFLIYLMKKNKDRRWSPFLLLIPASIALVLTTLIFRGIPLRMGVSLMLNIGVTALTLFLGIKFTESLGHRKTR